MKSTIRDNFHSMSVNVFVSERQKVVLSVPSARVSLPAGIPRANDYARRLGTALFYFLEARDGMSYAEKVKIIDGLAFASDNLDVFTSRLEAAARSSRSIDQNRRKSRRSR